MNKKLIVLLTFLTLHSFTQGSEKPKWDPRVDREAEDVYRKSDSRKEQQQKKYDRFESNRNKYEEREFRKAPPSLQSYNGMNDDRFIRKQRIRRAPLKKSRNPKHNRFYTESHRSDRFSYSRRAPYNRNSLIQWSKQQDFRDHSDQEENYNNKSNEAYLERNPQHTFSKYERMDVISKTRTRNNENLNELIKILERCVDFLNFEENIVLFNTILEQFGETFTFTIIEMLDTSIKDDLMAQVIGNKRFGLNAKQSLRIDPDVYLSLINALNVSEEGSDIAETVIKIVQENISSHAWDRIEPQIVAVKKTEAAQSSDDKLDNTFSDESDLKEIEKIFKDGKATENRVKAQYVLDAINTYFSQKKQKADAFAFLKNEKNVAMQERILAIFENLLKEYQELLGQKKVKMDVLASATNHVKKNLSEDHPRAAAYIYGQFLEQIKKDQKLENKIKNGFRISIDNAFLKYEKATQEKRQITFNTHLMYLLCIQVLARFEDSISNADEFTSIEDFKARTKKILEDIADKFDHQGNIDGVVRSIFEAINGRSDQTDIDILFASTTYELILSFGFSDKQQRVLLEEVRKLFESNGVTLQKVKKYDENKNESIKTNKSLLSYDTEKSLEPFTISGEESKDDNTKENKDPVKKLEDTAVNALQDSLAKGISSLLGGR